MTTTRMLRAVVALAGGAGLVLALTGPADAQQDPPGNNGTIKIDGRDFDDHPNNEPHVGCQFQVDFYGYDEGDLSADLTFEAIPPTADDEVLLTDTLFIGEDAAGGGTDHDASGTYDLTDELADIAPQPQQGWHIRLTIEADGSQGNDTKTKVFWVTGCGGGTTTTSSSTTSTSSTSTSSTSSTSTSSTSSSTTSTTTPDDTTTTTGPDDSTTTTAAGGSTTTTAAGGTTPSTGPGGLDGPGAPSAPGGPGVSPGAPTTAPVDRTGLPRTGSSTVPLAVGALALLALGTGSLAGARYLTGARS